MTRTVNVGIERRSLEETPALSKEMNAACPPKIEMSSSYQSRNVRYANVSNHWVLRELQGSSREFGRKRQSTPGQLPNRGFEFKLRSQPFVGASPGVLCRRAMPCGLR